MTLTKINKATCQHLRKDVEQALKTVADKHGIRITTGRGTFTDADFTMKIEMAVIGEGGVNLKAKLEFEQLAAFVGLKPEHFGLEFTSGGERYQIVGIKSRATAKPVLVLRLRDGQRFVMPAGPIQRYISDKHPNHQGS